MENTEKTAEQTAEDLVRGFTLKMEGGQVFKFRPAKVRELYEYESKRNDPSDTVIEYLDKAKALIKPFQTNPDDTDFDELELSEVNEMLEGITRQNNLDFTLKKNLGLQ